MSAGRYYWHRLIRRVKAELRDEGMLDGPDRSTQPAIDKYVVRRNQQLDDLLRRTHSPGHERDQ